MGHQHLHNKEHQEKSVLFVLLFLNMMMFIIEMWAGYIAKSAGLIADGLDMLSDAGVYGIALFAVGKSMDAKLMAARFAGGIQIVLSFAAFGRVIYQMLNGYQPSSDAMIYVSLLALAVNVFSLWIVSNRKDDGVHMKASYIFSANDVLANLGVISAGLLVAYFNSPIPDWIIGALIGIIVINGAVSILRLKSA